MNWTQRHQHWLITICVVYLGLGGLYAWATPPLEASDEYKHYPVVQHIQTTGRLPILDPAEPGLWANEAAQPPLYYWLMAAATWPLDTADLPTLHQLNPHFFVGNPLQHLNKNIIAPPLVPALVGFSSGSVQAIYLIRWLSLLLGVGTIWLTAALGRRFLPATAALAASGLTALNPMFLFVSAAVNNDSLSIFWSIAGLVLLVDMWREPPPPHQSWWPYVRLGMVCGLALLTKLSLAVLLLLAGCILAWRAWQRGEWALLFKGGLLTLAIAMVLWAPWLWRNWQLYGDITALNVFVEVQGTRPEQTLGGVDWRGEFGSFYRSFWGQFGGVNINAPEWYYTVANGWFMVCLLGWGVYVGQEWRRGGGTAVLSSLITSGAWLLLAQMAITFVLLIRWTIIHPSFQGRLMFPALPAINLGLMAGWWQWQGWVKAQPTAVGVAPLLFFGGAAVFLPLAVIQPNYQLPTPLTAVPAESQFGPIRFQGNQGQELLLVGVEPFSAPPSTTPGDPYGVDITLYWTLARPTEHNLVTSVHTLGRGLDSVGQSDRYPGWGLWPTSRWLPGEIYRDTYRVQVRPDGVAPSRLLFTLGVLSPELGEEKSLVALTPLAPDGTLIPLVVVGEARLAADGRVAESVPTHLLAQSFEEGIVLQGYDQPETAVAGQALEITLHWQATATPSQGYTVFFHLLDANQNYVLGADSPPLNGEYPTYLWRAGDRITETRRFELPATLPPGNYFVATGLYHPLSGVRLSLTEAGGGDSIVWPLIIRGE